MIIKKNQRNGMKSLTILIMMIKSYKNGIVTLITKKENSNHDNKNVPLPNQF